MVSQSDSQVVQDYGMHWKESERVQEYVERTDREGEERGRLFTLMAHLAPFDLLAPVRALDIGTGHGPVVTAVLDAFPNGTAVGLDISDAMMEVGRQRMARFGDRFRYHVGDFGKGLPADLTGPFDIVVASASIHHLPAGDRQVLYKSVFDRLAPGGCFFNLDTMNPKDEFLRARYRQVRDIARAGQPMRPRNDHGARFAHFMDPADDHLAALRDAGFSPVDCFWKNLSRCLIGGFKQGA